jgi:hypothetical protein
VGGTAAGRHHAHEFVLRWGTVAQGGEIGHYQVHEAIGMGQMAVGRQPPGM